jgi:hypothetical protein
MNEMNKGGDEPKGSSPPKAQAHLVPEDLTPDQVTANVLQ